MVDGDPACPDLDQCRLVEEPRPTVRGVAPAYLTACRNAGIEPVRERDLSSIRTLFTAGSPLPLEVYLVRHEQLGPEMLLYNGSGGTDVCTGFVRAASPSVVRGRDHRRVPGVQADAFDRDGTI